eukprot:tig00001094_g6981.t1
MLPATTNTWAKGLLQRVHGTLLWSLLPFAIWGPSHFPYIFSFVFMFNHVCLAICNIRMAYGYFHSYRAVISHAKLDWHGRYIQAKEKGHVRDMDFEDVQHMIVIPNYKEEIETLRETLDCLASHSRSRQSYSIVLAMEEAEQGAFEKASQLIKLYQDTFREIIFTLHPAGLPGEARGKSSNVSWAVRQASKGFQGSNVVVTVLDADIMFGEAYFAAVTYHFCVATPEEREKMMFAPPVIFDRNSHEVPAINRLADIMWSICVQSNLSSNSPFKFPCSAYSVSLDLARFVGFWDSGPEAMGEDLHMYLKCFFATQGKLIVKPIFSPASCCNVTGTSYVNTFVQRFTQAKRHLWGSLDIAYCLEQTLVRKVKPPFMILCGLFHRLFEMHLMLAHMTLLVIFLFFIPVTDPFVLACLRVGEWIRNGCVIPTIVIAICYERYHAWAVQNTPTGSKAYRTWSQRIDWTTLLPSGMMFVFVPQVYAHTMQLFTNRLDYVVSTKPVSKRADEEADESRTSAAV